MFCYTETSRGLKIPISDLKKLKRKTKSKLALDATSSFGLEKITTLPMLYLLALVKDFWV